MPLKWMAVVVATVSSTLCATANVAVGTLQGRAAPMLLNVLTITVASVSTLLAVIAELHERLDARIDALTDFLVTRLNELDSRSGDHNAGFVEGYLLNHAHDATVVPLGTRLSGRRAIIGNDD